MFLTPRTVSISTANQEKSHVNETDLMHVGETHPYFNFTHLNR